MSMVCHVYGLLCLGFVMSSVCLSRVGYGTGVQKCVAPGRWEEAYLFKIGKLSDGPNWVKWLSGYLTKEF